MLRYHAYCYYWPRRWRLPAQPLTDVEYISVSAVSATPSMLEDAIARLAK